MMKRTENASERGFTLVELSIVLVILGLLIGGVLTGQSLIRAAELRSVSTQYTRYATAVNTFRDKYFGLPGDLTNATSYWGEANTDPATCATTPSTDSKTCNGNGNGLIVDSPSNERYRFWQHLANAGLIEGSYDGVSHGSTAFSSTTANSPAGRISSSLWYAGQAGNTGIISGESSRFDGVYDNTFEFGGVQANLDPYAPIFKPEEAYNIDMKMDDGKPATGKIVIRAVTNVSSCTNVSSGAALTADYLLNSATLGCALYFRRVY